MDKKKNLANMTESPQKLDDANKLEQLAKVLVDYNLSAVEILEDDKKYRVEKELAPKADQNPVFFENKTENKNLYTITSPMVGVFYDTASMTGEALVAVGKQFEKGDALCVLEAMKTFTEILAEDSGEIKEICVKNGDIVEYSQPLFKYIKN